MYGWVLGTIIAFVVVGFLWKACSSHLSRRRATNRESEYYEAMNNYITSMGFYEAVLQLQGTDMEYCIASMKLQKAGYLVGESEKVIGALIMDSSEQYKKNRELAILFLKCAAEDMSKGSEKR